jgi:proline iminopeptidase
MRLIYFSSFLALTSCKEQPKTNEVSNYFNYGDSLETAGVKMILFKRHGGNLKFDQTLWNQPKIKILLLHGGSE